ncbi:hypothetical protein IX299_001891 [Porphyromonas levii]|nr:hypothetical protein [Porphyromonas levii]
MVCTVCQFYLHTLLLGGWQECLDKAMGNHRVDGLLIIGKHRILLAGRDDSVVVGHLAVVHRLAVERDRKRLLPYFGDKLWDFLKEIFRDIATTRAWIGGYLLLVEALCDRQGLVGRETVATIGFLLKCGQVIQEGWRGLRYPSCDLSDRKRVVRAELCEHTLGCRFIIILLQRIASEREVGVTDGSV